MTQAESSYLEAIAGSSSREDAARLLLAQKYIDGFSAISANPAHKVFVPNSFAGLFAFPSERSSDGPRLQGDTGAAPAPGSTQAST